MALCVIELLLWPTMHLYASVWDYMLELVLLRYIAATEIYRLRSDFINYALLSDHCCLLTAIHIDQHSLINREQRRPVYVCNRLD